jgi:hypothetical protein
VKNVHVLAQLLMSFAPFSFSSFSSLDVLRLGFTLFVQILVMDSSRENSKDYVKNVRHLVFQLERAKRLMNGEVEKYCLFIHFSRHSMSTSPPMKVSMETLKCLTDRYPEHLGNAGK